MDDTRRIKIADALERLAAQPVWSDEVWKHCYDLVSANMDDDVVAYVYDDLVHCSGKRLFSSKRPEFDTYKQEFRDIAEAIRARLSLAEARKKFGL